MATSKTDRALIERNMTNHPPDEQTQATMEDVRKAYKKAGLAILTDIPDCRERALALTNLEQSLMWCMAALARTNHDDRSNGG